MTIQHFLAERFRENGFEVKEEWDVSQSSRDALNRRLYCPRLDLCVLPLNIDAGTTRVQDINTAVEQHRGLLRKIFQASHRRNYEFESFLGNGNQNPRCFLAIEVERSGSRKHMMGDIVNVAFLGKFGIIVAIGQKKYRGFVRILDTLNSAARSEKLRNAFLTCCYVRLMNFLQLCSKVDFGDQA
jgi:hypothetical protein